MADIRAKAVYFAKLAEQTKRYGDTVEKMKEVLKMKVELTKDERNLLSIGCRRVVGPLRASWRILLAMEEKEESGSNIGYIKEYRVKVEGEISDICEEILSIIHPPITPSPSTHEASLFYWKMRGDHYRYLAEITTGNDKKENTDLSQASYEGGKMVAEKMLPTDPGRLGLALNHSVLHYVIFDSPGRALDIAKKAFEEATPELAGLSEEARKATDAVLHILQKNITLWERYQKRTKKRTKSF